MSQLAFAALVAVFPILVVFAAASDFFTMTISNRLSATVFLAGAIAVAWTAPGWYEAGSHLGAAAIVFVLGFAVFSFGFMGGGDVKFAAAIAFWFGLGQMLEFIVAFSIYGGLLTFLVLAADRALSHAPNFRVGFLVDFPERRRVPYGIALSVAAMEVFARTDWMKALMIG